jgi:flagellar basal body rod protein FlgB
VSKASLPGAQFALPVQGEAAAAQDAPVDVEGEMMALADEQLRFLATSRLLEKTYSSLRNAIKGGNG